MKTIMMYNENLEDDWGFYIDMENMNLSLNKYEDEYDKNDYDYEYYMDIDIESYCVPVCINVNNSENKKFKHCSNCLFNICSTTIIMTTLTYFVFFVI